MEAYPKRNHTASRAEPEPEALLRDLGVARRALGRQVGATWEYAWRYVEDAYARGDFGAQERPEFWRRLKALDLAAMIEGVCDDWLWEITHNA